MNATVINYFLNLTYKPVERFQNSLIAALNLDDFNNYPETVEKRLPYYRQRILKLTTLASDFRSIILSASLSSPSNPSPELPLPPMFTPVLTAYRIYQAKLKALQENENLIQIVQKKDPTKIKEEFDRYKKLRITDFNDAVLIAAHLSRSLNNEEKMSDRKNLQEKIGNIGYTTSKMKCLLKACDTPDSSMRQALDWHDNRLAALEKYL